ncbi:MAG: patatin-like phospholipase family protein, partial [Alphaproteobacteria bacterium]|nr:patatin-like phospholipase family protein [Alphaproteobacteria bacterium]
MDDQPHLLRKGVAVALGGGGARGFAHICVIEALDELGIKPVAIAGTSIGAVIGAAWAAGISGKEIRAHVEKFNRHRAEALARVFRSRATNLKDVFARGINPVLLDGEKLLDMFWPEGVPDRFEDLEIPFSCVATDFYARREAVFSSGALTPAVAASMAVP